MHNRNSVPCLDLSFCVRAQDLEVLLALLYETLAARICIHLSFDHCILSICLFYDRSDRSFVTVICVSLDGLGTHRDHGRLFVYNDAYRSLYFLIATETVIVRDCDAADAFAFSLLSLLSPLGAYDDAASPSFSLLSYQS